MIIFLSKVKQNTVKINMKSFYYCLVVLGMMTLLGVSAMSYNLAFAEISTDKPTYAKGELLDVSGSLDIQTDEPVNIIKIEITNLNDENNKIVDEYTPIEGNNTFSRSYETITWEAGEYKVTVRYNQTSEETEFEITGSSSVFSTDVDDDARSDDDDDSDDARSDDDDDSDDARSDDDDDSDDARSDDDDDSDDARSDDDDDSDDARSDDDDASSQQQFSSSSTITPGSPVDPPTVPVAPSTESNTMNNQILALQSENQQLQNENNQLKAQFEELNKRVEQLDAIIKEQLRVMMETLATL